MSPLMARMRSPGTSALPPLPKHERTRDLSARLAKGRPGPGVSSHKDREALYPSQARKIATAQAIQFGHSGIIIVPHGVVTATGHPSTARAFVAGAEQRASNAPRIGFLHGGVSD